MNVEIIKKISILSFGFILLGIIVFIINFHNQQFSDNISDWGSFGSYISGIVTPILTGLNIYIFFILTKMASEFGTKNVQKQLSFSTCQEYQNKINDLTFEFLANIELYKESLKDEYIVRATDRLNWIKFFIDSFVKEAEPLITKNFSEIVNKKKDFEISIDQLIESKFSKKSHMEHFFQKKSEFIKVVFEYMIK